MLDSCGFTWSWLLLWVLENMHIKDNRGVFIRKEQSNYQPLQTSTGQSLEEVIFF